MVPVVGHSLDDTLVRYATDAGSLATTKVQLMIASRDRLDWRTSRARATRLLSMSGCHECSRPPPLAEPRASSPASDRPSGSKLALE